MLLASLSVSFFTAYSYIWFSSSYPKWKTAFRKGDYIRVLWYSVIMIYTFTEQHPGKCASHHITSHLLIKTLMSHYQKNNWNKLDFRATAFLSWRYLRAVSSFRATPQGKTQTYCPLCPPRREPHTLLTHHTSTTTITTIIATIYLFVCCRRLWYSPLRCSVVFTLCSNVWISFRSVVWCYCSLCCVTLKHCVCVVASSNWLLRPLTRRLTFFVLYSSLFCIVTDVCIVSFWLQNHLLCSSLLLLLSCLTVISDDIKCMYLLHVFFV